LRGDGARRRAFSDHLQRARERGAQVVHLHNPWPLFTYDIALAAQDAGLPIVQTLHNYRLIGTNDRLVSAGRLRAPHDAAERQHLARMANNHPRLANPFYNRALAAWWSAEVPQTAVDAYLCLTGYQEGLMRAAGIPPGRTQILPNFLDHRGPIGAGPGDFALFVGRLDHTKGIHQLVDWWPSDGPALKVVGEGPLAHLLDGHPRIEPLGRRPFDEVQVLMSEARFLVMASTWYEAFPLVLIEALAAGTPCLVPNLGGLPEIIQEGITGMVFQPDDPRDAAVRVASLWEAAPAMRAACRADYEMHYTPESHLRCLRELYETVIRDRHPSG
jgi:glycosyltransferase involved in cell wall biosynthesis